MPSTLPFGTAIGIGAETTYGTAVSITNWMEVESCEIAEVANYERFPVLDSSASAGNRFQSHIASKLLSGRIVMPLQYAGAGFVLEQLLGGVTTTGSSPYTHTYNLDAVPPRYLTIEKVLGGTARSETYTGVCVTGGSLSVRRNGLVMLTLEVSGYKSNGFGSATAPSFGATVNSRAVKSRHLDNAASGIPGEITWNSVNYAVQDLGISWSNNVTPVGDVGSFYPTAYDQGGERMITVSATTRHIGSASEALRTAHLAETSSDITFTFTGDSANQSIAFTCRNAKITSLPAVPLSGGDRVMMRPTWTLHDDASDGALTVAVTNTDATHSAN